VRHVLSLSLGAALWIVAAGTAQANEGESLFDPATYQPLAADRKAFKVGDLLTVVIQENASATSAVDSNAARSTGLAVQVDPLKGASRNLAASINTDANGGGRTQRSGRLLAQLTVSVTDVQPNGDLTIVGSQDLVINGEAQFISLQGKVRPKDITDGNLVSSTRVADAQIRFEGEGFISEKSRPGWVTRLLSFFGL
jgi:flagellar L-ring protein precursor FlgH